MLQRVFGGLFPRLSVEVADVFGDGADATPGDPHGLGAEANPSEQPQENEMLVHLFSSDSEQAGHIFDACRPCVIEGGQDADEIRLFLEDINLFFLHNRFLLTSEGRLH